MSGTPDRRRFMAQATAALAAAGLVAAPKLTQAAAGSDAELIGLCHRIVALEAEFLSLAEPYYDTLGDVPAEVDERQDAIVHEQHDLKDRVARIMATTDRGRKAKALVLATCLNLMADGSLCYTNSAELLAWSIARDLAGPDGVPGEPGEPFAVAMQKENDAMLANSISSPRAAS